MPDPDLEIRGGGGGRSSRPLGKGGGALQKFFRPFGPQFGLKIRGGTKTKTLFIILMVRSTRCPTRDTFANARLSL